MADTFLKLYPKLLKQANNASSPPTGLWLAHGDEPLLQQWLAEAMRKSWQQHHYAIKRLDLVSSKTWYEAITELSSLSLFDEATALIVTGNHKPDKTVQAQLEAFGLDANSGNNQNCLLWLTGKIDKRAQSGKWFMPFAKLARVVDCNIYDESQRHRILQQQASHFGLQLSNDAWQLLMEQTEHYLLGAYQALWRLSYLFLDRTSNQNVGSDNSDSLNNSANALQAISIDVDALQSALVSDSHYSVFDLSDAMLSGNVQQVVKIIGQLKATDEPASLVLWTLSKDMRLIMQLLDGQDPQSIGIWNNKQGLYNQASRRQTQQSVSDWSTLLYECDKAIKGLIRQPAWELILQASLRVAGVRLFDAVE